MSSTVTDALPVDDALGADESAEDADLGDGATPQGTGSTEPDTSQ